MVLHVTGTTPHLVRLNSRACPQELKAQTLSAATCIVGSSPSAIVVQDGPESILNSSLLQGVLVRSLVREPRPHAAVAKKSQTQN